MRDERYQQEPAHACDLTPSSQFPKISDLVAHFNVYTESDVAWMNYVAVKAELHKNRHGYISLCEGLLEGKSSAEALYDDARILALETAFDWNDQVYIVQDFITKAIDRAYNINFGNGEARSETQQKVLAHRRFVISRYEDMVEQFYMSFAAVANSSKGLTFEPEEMSAIELHIAPTEINRLKAEACDSGHEHLQSGLEKCAQLPIFSSPIKWMYELGLAPA